MNRRLTAVKQIQQFIQSNRLQPGERIPTVRKLSEHFAITRDSVWRALRQMHDEGWLDVLPNKRYTVSQHLYAKILRSIRVRALFSGEGYIYFSGFRRLADSLTHLCHNQTIDLGFELLPLGAKPQSKIWEDCDVLLVDSDSSSALLETFSTFPVPVIGLDANYSDRYLANIVTDHHFGGRIVAEAFLHQQKPNASVIYHSGSENKARITARLDGFRQAWLEAGRSEDSVAFVPIEWSSSSFQIALHVKAFLEQNPAHGTYFVTDGLLATSFLDVLDYQGVRVPREVGLIGYDGAQRGELTNPPMTTIQQDMESIAESALEWIHKIARGDQTNATSLVRIPPVLVKRSSF
ncbi:MAG: GntR family transcriptional regulator [Candidatus Methylacidiphilales bacterium]|nr:GntR family transcriptional regulator [Candidatus Methylacidiphilales bacterium]